MDADLKKIWDKLTEEDRKKYRSLFDTCEKLEKELQSIKEEFGAVHLEVVRAVDRMKMEVIKKKIKKIKE